MNTKVLTTLEYTKIIDLLTEKADSEPGKKLCMTACRQGMVTMRGANRHEQEGR